MVLDVVICQQDDSGTGNTDGGNTSGNEGGGDNQGMQKLKINPKCAVDYSVVLHWCGGALDSV